MSRAEPVLALHTISDPGVYEFLGELYEITEGGMTVTASQATDAIGRGAVSNLVNLGLIERRALHPRAVDYALSPFGMQTLRAAREAVTAITGI